MVSRPLWLIYALGGGFGHLTRACALARAGPPDIHIRILTNSPYARRVVSAMPELDVVALDPPLDPTSGVAHGRAEVLREIASAEAAGLIVDTFPRGLAGELVTTLSSFSGWKVFVQRDLNPHYAAKYNLNSFVAASYDLVLVPGDSTPDSLGPFPQTVTTAPWLIRSPDETLPRARARKILRLEDEKACILVCAAGNVDELAWYGAVVSQLLEGGPQCAVRCVTPVRPDACPPECWVDYWPAMDLYPAADVVIGGAGYNTIYECVACGVPLIAKAWRRKYDRQHLRARHATCIAGEPDEAVEGALQLLSVPRPAKRQLRLENGAAAAAAHIAKKSGAPKHPL